MARIATRPGFNSSHMGGLSMSTAQQLYLLHDQFPTADAVPLATPHNCEPGPGALTVVDTEEKLSISDGVLVCAGAKASPAWGDPMLMTTGSYAVRAGLCFDCKITPTATNTWGDAGFYSTATPAAETDRFSVRFNNDATISIMDKDEPHSPELGLMPYAGGTDYWVRVLCTSAGKNYYYSLDGATWYLIWASTVGTTTPVWVGLANTSMAFSSDNWRLQEGIAVPSALADDTFTRADSALTLGSDSTGKAWTAVSGTWGISSNKAYSASDANFDIATIASGGKDGIWEATVSGTLASAVNYRIPALVFRYLDGLNFLLAYLLNSGLYLAKIDGGSLTALGAQLATTADGTDYLLRVVAAGNEITVVVLSPGDLALNAGIWYTLAGGDTKYNAYTTSGMVLIKAGSPATAARWDGFKVQGGM